MSQKEPREYDIAGRPITCNHCQNTRFRKGATLLNTSTMTLLGLDWANRSAITLMCDNCGLVHWFAKPPEAKQA